MWTMSIAVLFDQMSTLRLAYAQKDLLTQTVRFYEFFDKIYETLKKELFT